MSTDWERLTVGDKEAFVSIYNSHYQALFCYGFSITMDRDLTKDCIHDMFLEIWNKHSSLNREVVNVRSYLFTWLRRTISHELAHIEKDLPADPSEAMVSQASYEDLLVAFQQTEENKQALKTALSKLSRKQLEIIRLKFFENLSYRDISVKLSLTPRTIYNLVYEGLRHLKETIRIN
jgi:RNA polymerase sigma factor (sigma-70 family)